MWAHNLYPRLQFSDFARTILKTTANPRVKAKLHEWQDEHREKTDEYARIAREQGNFKSMLMDYGLTQIGFIVIAGENGEGGYEDGDNQEQQASSDNEDSDQDMNDVFMDYLVGVKSGAISIEDAPPVPEQNNNNDNPRPNNDIDDDEKEEEDLFFKPATEREPSPGPGSPMDISSTTPQRPTLSKETSNISAMKGITSDDDEDDDNEPLFMNRRPRRITTEDEDMSE